MDAGYFYLCFILTSLISRISTVNIGGSINIDLSSYDVLNKSTHVFKFHEVLNGRADLNVEKVPQDVGFFIIQVHSFQDSIVLSNTSNPNCLAKGTNIGFVQTVHNTSSYKYYLRGETKSANLSVFIVVVAYVTEDPIPGDCNVKSGIRPVPYQNISYADYLIQVDFQAPSVGGHTCKEHAVRVTAYHMFLEEWDLSPKGYFQGLDKLLTPDDIIKYGTKVPEPRDHSPLTRYYNAYSGTGSVFAVIASFGNHTSAYVPAVSYACDVMRGAESCYGPVTVYWKVLCGLMVFFGLFLCFLGHRFFRWTLFFTGFLVASVVTYILISYSDLDFGESLVTLGIIGILYGALWVLIWCIFGIPLLSVTSSFVVAGYLISSIFFYMGLADVQVFRNDVNYWSVMLGILLVVTVVLLILSTFNSNIFVTSFLGSYMFIVPIDHYIGGNLRYIFLNTLHRATVPNYNLAVVAPPYQTNDENLTIFWALLTLVGMCAQWRHNKGRAPFPPAVVPEWGRSHTERTPLLVRQYP